MNRDARRLFGFMARHAGIGFAISALFVAVVTWANVGQLGTLFAESSVGWFAAALLFFFCGLTFGSVQIGIAIMMQARNDELPPGPGGSRR